MKSLQIHQFVDHHHEAAPGLPGTGNQHLPVTGNPVPAPRILHPTMQIAPSAASVLPVGSHPGLVYATRPLHIDPNAGVPRISPHLPQLNGGGPGSRDGSISSDSGEGRAASPIVNLKCELCGLSNITSSKALQQV